MSLATPVVGTWDGINRRIYLLQGVDAFHWMDDIYIEYREERRTTEAFRNWDAFMVASGNVSKGLGKATPRLLTLLDGVKIIPYDEAGEIQVSGEAITDNADIDATLFDISGLTNPVVIQYQPPSAEVILVDEIQKALDYAGVLHFDMANINGTGQDHPVGTSANPVNNISDGLAIAIKFYLSEVHTHSNITMDRDVEKFSIKGLVPDLILNPNGFKIDLSNIEGLDINGNFNGSHLHIKDCEIIEALNIHGKIKDSFHSGRILITANQGLKMADCESGIAGLGSPVLDMNQGQDTIFSGRNISGGITIEYCDTPNCITTIGFSDGGKPHLEPSCTDGLISIRGIADLDDRSNGSTIETGALSYPNPNPNPKDPQENYNSIKYAFDRLYKHENLSYKIKMNDTLNSTLKVELEEPNLTSLYISSYQLLIVIDNSYIGVDFKIYGEGTPPPP